MVDKTKINQKNVEAGRDFIVNTGTLSINGSERLLKKSQIYECLKFFENDLHESTMDISVPPAKLNKKLSFNHAGKYINLFKDCYLDIDLVSQVLANDFSSSGEIIVSDLKNMFFQVVPNENYRDDGTVIINNGDVLLDRLRERILERIKNDPRYRSDKLSIEVVDKFVYAFIGYGVNECQVLLNPNKSKER